ncbi:hypothetical protein [Pelomonas cellulosilytica]|uniref:SnoaL-like domain-containing protein n=1 Tax=Pelomonas cellulosilytica TaxID=2906762 RepID=A0ABS8XZX9_9BURK|nr:hypothetical protein [Pelomonas sp. P8]MCE4558161.1 hypothetical protein [Pelomonas sp. P8]
MNRLTTSAPLGLFTSLVAAFSVVAAAVLSLPADAAPSSQSPGPATSPCDDAAALQRRLDDFDARWNASDAWGLAVQFTTDGRVGTAGEPGRAAVYREIVERLGRTPVQRHTRVLRATPLGAACRVDVQVQTVQASGELQEAGVFVLVASPEGGIAAVL